MSAFSHTVSFIPSIILVCVVLFVLLFWDKKHVRFLLLLQNKMQTDQDEQQSQGEGQKETEEKTPRENEEMEVRSLMFVWNKCSYQFIKLSLQGDKIRKETYNVQFFTLVCVMYRCSNKLVSHCMSWLILNDIRNLNAYSLPLFRQPQRRAKVRRSPTSPHKPRSPKSKQKCWTFQLKTVHSGS